jgi:hypothetical protein
MFNVRDRIARRVSGRRTRGQAMVEFAIILPVLAVLLVMAVDAGRLFFGYVALHNAARIGADFAASHAGAWDGTPNPIEQQDLDRYQLVLAQDMLSLGCDTAGSVPDPNFDPDGDGAESFADGSYVRVTLDCDFHPLTPLAEAFLGQPLNMRASADFAINRSISAGLPPPGNPPPDPSGSPGASPSPSSSPSPSPSMCTAPDLISGNTKVNQAQGRWAAAGFTTTIQITRPPNGNYDINSQGPLGPLQVGPCNTVETVGP